MKEFYNQSFEDLINNEAFIAWVRERLIQTDDLDISQIMSTDDSSLTGIQQAIAVLKLMDDDQKGLSPGQRNELRKRILHFSQTYRLQRRRRLWLTTGMAASFLTLALMGGWWLWMNFFQTQSYHFASQLNNSGDQKTVLVLSDGQRIEMESDESEVKVIKEAGAVQIDTDSIVTHENKDGGPQLVFHEMTVPYGKKARLVLEDGTKVWLNAGSHFAFPQAFGSKNREVFLEGEGYFEVAENPNRPFAVNTRNVQVEVLGTKFNLSAYDSDDFTETVLLSGKVSIKGKGRLINDQVVLSPNQVATYTKTEHLLKVEKALRPDLSIAWIEGWYQFENVSVDKVLAKIQRYYNVTFEFESDIFSRALPVSGKLDLKDSIEEVMPVIAKVARIEYEIADNRILIFKK